MGLCTLHTCCVKYFLLWTIELHLPIQLFSCFRHPVELFFINYYKLVQRKNYLK